jgi:hypothetical protein
MTESARYRQELTEAIEQIRTLAVDKQGQRYEHDRSMYLYGASGSGGNWGTGGGDEYPPWEDVKHEFEASVDSCLERFDYFMDPVMTPSVDALQVMINGLNDGRNQAVNVSLPDGAPDLAPDLGAAANEYVTDYIAYPGVTDRILTVEDTDISGVQSLIEQGDWEGPASDVFLQGFLVPYPEKAKRQRALVQELGAILRAYQQLVAGTQQTVLWIAKATRETLDAFDPVGEGGSLRDFIFVVGGAMASLLGAPGWVGAAISVANFASGMFENAPSEADSPTGVIEGDTVAEILESMVQRIDEVNSYRRDQEDSVIKPALDHDLGQIEGDGRQLFIPQLEDTFNPNEFWDQERHTVVETARLHMAGHVGMSAAAYNYDQAHRRLHLGSLKDSEAFGSWFLHSVGDFRELRDQVADILLATRDHLVEYGDALVDAAYGYAEQDGINAAEIDSRSEQITTQVEDGIPDWDERPTLNDEQEHAPYERDPVSGMPY